MTYVVRWTVWFSLIKGVLLGGTTVGVVRSGLSPFAQAIIIALVSAGIGAFGIIVAAFISAHSAQAVLREQEKLARRMEDVKAVVGANKREGDHAPDSPKD